MIFNCFNVILEKVKYIGINIKQKLSHSLKISKHINYLLLKLTLFFDGKEIEVHHLISRDFLTWISLLLIHENDN